MTYIRTPEIREKIRQSLLGNIPWNKGKKRPPFSKEWKEKIRQSSLGNKSHTGEKHDEAYKKRMSESCKGIKKHAGFGAMISKALKGKKKTPKHCENLRIAHIGKQALEKNPNWLGGKSFEEYPREFNKSLKLKIRQRDGLKCELCGITEEEHLKIKGIVLCVNHIDFNKSNCNEENLNTLCRKCNLFVNRDRERWTKIFKNKHHAKRRYNKKRI